MESAVNQGIMTDISSFVEKFDCAINTLLDGLKDFVLAEEKALAPKIAKGTVDLVRLSTLLGSLKRYVQKGMPKQCKEILEKTDNLVMSEEHRRSLVKLDNLISAYKFGEAKLVINSTLAKISEV